jgi:predicted tellurium resistance membrane protein TerC
VFIDMLASPEVWISFATLAALEIVLGIDNIVFIAILTSKLPARQQPLARRAGIGAALVTRLLLLFSLAWVIGLTEPVFSVFDHTVSWRDVILIGGGLFLLAKGTIEIHDRIEGEHEHGAKAAAAGFVAVVAQIAVLDIIFSLDSVITAVGMVDHLAVMVAAILSAVAVMLAAAGPLSAFIERHPTVKMLAMSFLLLIGMALVADGLGLHIPKGYLYFAIAFSVFVEALNLLARRRRSA